jgi:hypothetical protein
MEFYDKSDHDRFEIIAFHDATVESFEQLDEKLEDIRKSLWKGRRLPFPVLLDATGKTVKRFEIYGFPTQILFDPDGRLVGRANLDTLRRALKGEVETPTPVEPREDPTDG